MPLTADDAVSAAMRAVTRVLVWALLLVGVGLALIFAFAAAMVVGLVILGAAVAMRFAPGRGAPAAIPGVLEAHRTPDGWVVEGAAKRKS